MTTNGTGLLVLQSAMFAEVDACIDGPLPDVEDFTQDSPHPRAFQLLTGPLVALGRQVLRPPPDEPTSDRWRCTAARMLRLAMEAASRATPVGPGDEGWHSSARNNLEWELVAARACSEPDREKMKAALRAVAEPLLAGTNNDLEGRGGG